MLDAEHGYPFQLLLFPEFEQEFKFRQRLETARGGRWRWRRWYGIKVLTDVSHKPDRGWLRKQVLLSRCQWDCEYMPKNQRFPAVGMIGDKRACRHCMMSLC
jgi:hypothetical protein